LLRKMLLHKLLLGKLLLVLLEGAGLGAGSGRANADLRG
jgi:hypothetical protein